MSSTITPISPRERIQTIDIIRGIALLGILVINFTVDDGGGENYGFADWLVYWVVRLLLDDRFMAMYCFLFGLGFALQMQKAADKHSNFSFAYIRRMIALYFIGVSIALLTGEGLGLLTSYAMIGLLLLLFWKFPLKLLPSLAILFFLIPIAIDTVKGLKTEHRADSQVETETIVKVDSFKLDHYVGVYARATKTVFVRRKDSLIGIRQDGEFYNTPLSDTQFIRKDLNHLISFRKDSTGQYNIFVAIVDSVEYPAKRIQMTPQQALEEFKNESIVSYPQFVNANVDRFQYWVYSVVNNYWRIGYSIGLILVMFLFGLYAGKRRVFFDVRKNKDFLKNVFKWGLVLGFPLVLFRVGFEAWATIKNSNWNDYSFLTWQVNDIIWSIGYILMTLAYIAGLTLLLENPAWKNRLSFFGTVGRLGLTNYLLHLVAYMLIFKHVSWFWGLSGRVGNLYRLLLAIAVYIILYFFSKWWLQYFRYGPFEWLWRCITYWKMQPIRLKN